MINWDDFDKIWASTSPLTPYQFSDSNYAQGWNFVGATPPSRQMWDYIQKQNDEKFKYLRDNFGTPNMVTSSVQMTDTDKVYVYIGSEAGWNSGHWYYYDAGTSTWVDGGVYNSVAFVTDTTLSIAGQPADAEAVGNKFKSVVLGGFTYINSSNKASICNGTMDDIPVNTIYTVNSTAGLTNTPTELSGRTFGTVILSSSNVRNKRAGMWQLAVSVQGELWMRGYSTSNTWSAWRTIIDANRYKSAVVGAGGSLVTDANKGDICGGSYDGFAPNTIYTIDSTATLTNAPAFSGIITTIMISQSDDRSSLTGQTQFAFSYNGDIGFRVYAGGTWTDWNYVPVKDALRQKGTVSASDYSNLLSNIVDIGIYFFLPTDFTDSPVQSSVNSTLVVYPATSVFRVQVVYGSSAITGKYTYYRLIRQNGTVFKDWWCIGNTQIRTILGIGDSICKGERNSNYGYVGLVGVPYVNAGVSGSTLASGTGHGWIEQQLVDRTESTDYFDTIIMEGGINDYVHDVPLGTMSSMPVRTSDTALYNALDTTTVIGALEHMFVTLQSKYPNIDKFFLITHKTGNYPYTKNYVGGYTQDELHDAIVSVCKLYNVQVIDVYAESPINTYFPEYVSPTNWADDHTVTDLYWVNSDKVHPLNYGYKHGYLPLVLKSLEGASHKE